MAFMKVETTETRPNFLGSEIGLIQKTYEIKQEGVAANAAGRKIVTFKRTFRNYNVRY